jgi:hypothetical protein
MCNFFLLSLAAKGKKHTHPHRAGQGQGRVGQGGTKKTTKQTVKLNPVMKLHTFQLVCPKLENKIHHRRSPNLKEINPSG